jgi:glycosyltransferase involved in cell wall biosynthesis
MSKLRVLIVGPSFDILGGQAVQVGRLLDRLRNESALETGFLPINPRLPGVFRKLQSIKFVRTVATSFAYVLSLLARVRKFDVIHVFSASYFSFVLAPTPAILIAKLYGKKVVLNYHSGEAEDHLRRWRRTAIPTIKLADRIAVPSEYLEDVFKEFGLAATPIYNLIETEKFRFREREPLQPAFLSNRNFEAHYGVDDVLRAFALIQKQVSAATLTVAGDGPERMKLAQLAVELNLQNTKFVGRVEHDQIIDLYNATDVFLNGSLIDNQPLSILEAFACGLPVVTTNAGGIPYMVEHERTALLVERNDYEGLASAALRLFNERDLRRRLIADGQRECQKYSWSAVREQWLDLYAQVAGNELASAQTSVCA